MRNKKAQVGSFITKAVMLKLITATLVFFPLTGGIAAYYRQE